MVARRVADKLRGGYAKVVLVENKPGAGGRLAVEELKRSAPDGSTLLITPAAMITLYPHLYPRLPYGLADVTPVAGVTSVVFGLAIGPAVPDSVKTLKDFLAWAKANPSRAAFGSPGAGSPPHYLGALLDKESGVELNHALPRHVPGVQDLLGGQIAAFSGPIGDYLPHVKTGRLRVLATSGPTRSLPPEVPTFTELGCRSKWSSGTASSCRAGRRRSWCSARAAIGSVMGTAEMAEALAPFGLEVAVTTPAQLAQAVKDENAAWAPVVKRVGFTPES